MNMSTGMLIDSLRTVRPDTEERFVLYVVPAGHPAAELGRSIEREVFYEHFGDTPELLAAEYDQYEPDSVFLVTVDHQQQKAAGVSRLVLPSVKGWTGFKSLADLADGWGVNPNTVLPETSPGATPDKTFDIATLAVRATHRGTASAGTVAMSLYQGWAMLAVALETTHIVAIVDKPVLRMGQSTFCRPWTLLAGCDTRPYLGSERSQPIVCCLTEYHERLTREAPDMEAVLFRGEGIPDVSLPDVSWVHPDTDLRTVDPF